jgi:hypothetical protein
MLTAIARERESNGPFSVAALTEDYELGIRIKAAGGRSRFLRVRGEDGQLVATRACFPARIDYAVRQEVTIGGVRGSLKGIKGTPDGLVVTVEANFGERGPITNTTTIPYGNDVQRDLAISNWVKVPYGDVRLTRIDQVGRWSKRDGCTTSISSQTH